MFYNEYGDSMRILCIGHASYDITFPINGYPMENTKNRVKQKVECGGGPAATAAYLLGCWNADVAFIGIVGNDEYGQRIKDEFVKANVDIRNIEVSYIHETTTSMIINNKENGSRTTLTYRPSTMQLRPFQIDYKPDIILMDGQEYMASLRLIKENPNAITIMDGGRATKENIALSYLVKHLVCSKEFAEDVTNMKFDFNDKSTLLEIFRQMKRIFRNNIVITLEDKGCLYEYNNEVKLMPTLKVKTVDSTGAGDIFHGAFAYGLSKGYDFEKIVKLSNVAGALSVTNIGGRNSIPSKQEMKKHINGFE